MMYVFLSVFLVASVLNLIAAAKTFKVLSAVTKPLLLLSLCLYTVFHGLPEPDCLLAAALCACWLGDVLLMLKGEGWFFAGGLSFFAGHVLIILNFARSADLKSIPYAAVIPVAAVYAAITVFVITRSVKEAPKLMIVPAFLYLMCNSATNVFALILLLQSPGLHTATAFAGAVLFFLSDCILVLQRYDTRHKWRIKTHFAVMLTYISGVLLITLGFAPLF